MMSASPPSTGMASSQVIGTVIKFRCLYTHDLRRKSKRWQDGYLRYHTFNKRVMVFDCQGNFIGDHHWRSADEVQDGDELELDKGVLVQVTERMGTTQTDLSNLFERKKPSQGSPQSKDPASQPTRTPAPVRSSSSHSRSLNDMLGIKKTPIAHLISPYEERHPPQPMDTVRQSSERAPKRQRISQGTSRLRLNDQPDLVDRTQGKDTTSTRSTSSTRETTNHQKDPDPPSYEGRTSDASKATTQAKPDPRPLNRTQPPAPTSSISHHIPQAPATKGIGFDNVRSPSNNMPPPCRSFSSMSSSDAPTNTLRIATQQPRRKLMYKGLLPGQTSQNSSSGPPPPSATNHRLDATGAESQTGGAVTRIPKPACDEFVSSRSTQFILEQITTGWGEQPSLTTTAHQRPHTVIRETEPPVRQQPSSSQPTNIPMNRKGTIPKAANSTSASSVPLSESPRNSRTSAPFTEQRSSLADSQLQPESGQLVGPHDAIETPNQRVKRSLDAPLRKAISDPTALTARPSLQAPASTSGSLLSAVAESGIDQEQGPWTAEALDLFDFWPPGRPKPG